MVGLIIISSLRLFLISVFPIFNIFLGTDSSTILWMSTLVLGIKEINKYFGKNVVENGGDFL